MAPTFALVGPDTFPGSFLFLSAHPNFMDGP